ncbi:hypothetical protein N9R04_01275 [Staphylococcus sp. SQ8-PEA]|uniref:Secreted protein n=1 Tax=Staphylococcus marylandisciuri TaxID=2981529 RepID=A0ABT2QN02_9STAP|nr:hypothetical protein [Staphylococcus marylandisciuri]MCU5745350.1 hypothetical protein [Staphylococcus marylandisciuri]
MRTKEKWVTVVIVAVILVIFLMITFAKANENLDHYEKEDIKIERQQYLSKGAN